MPRPTYLDDDTARTWRAARFQDQTERDLFRQAFALNSEASINGLSSLVEPERPPEPARQQDTFNREPAPLPVVVSPRPGAEQQQSASDVLGPEFRSWRRDQRQERTDAELGQDVSFEDAQASGSPGGSPAAPAAPAEVPSRWQAGAPSSSAPSGYAPSTGKGAEGVERWSSLVSEAARAYNLPEATIKGLMEIESGGNPDAVSAVGAQGLLQVMPFHFQPGENPRDPRTNIFRGAKVYADALSRYGDPDKAAAAYFGAIDRNGNITGATDATGTNGPQYVALWRAAASKYGGSPPTAGSSSPAASPPAPPAGSPAPQAAGSGASSDTVTIEHIDDHRRLTIPRSSLPGYMQSPAPGVPVMWRVVGESAPVAQAQMSSTAEYSPDQPAGPVVAQAGAGRRGGGVMSVMRRTSPNMAVPSGDVGTGDEPGGRSLPMGITESEPVGVHEGYGLGAQAPGSMGYPIDQRYPGQQPYDVTDTEGADRSNDPYLQVPGRAAPSLPGASSPIGIPNSPTDSEITPSRQMYRQPLNVPTMGPDTFDQQPYNPDEGPRELGYSVPAQPVTYGDAGDAEQVPAYQPTYGPPLSEAGPEQSPGYLQQATDWLGSTAQQAGDVANRYLTTPIEPPARTPPLYGPFDLSDPNAFPDQESRNRFRSAQGGLQEDVAAIPYQAAEATRQSVLDAAQSFADAIHAGQEGRPLAAAGNALWSAIQAAGLPWTVAARTINEMVPELNVAGVGAGDVATSLDLVRLGVQGVNGLRKLPGALTPERLAAIHDLPGAAVEAARGLGSRIGEGLAENARNVAAADARMAEGGSTVAPGTLGVVTGNPLEANTIARSRIIPPDVADTLDFPLRVPEDPSVIRAIEAAGGRVDPERGVEFPVIRGQGPEAAGRPATRGGVFYEAGDRSNFTGANPTNDPKQVGGTEQIGPALTRYRSPLVLPDAPGSTQGFDEGIKALGIRTPEIEAAQRALEEANASTRQFLRTREAAMERWAAETGHGKTDWDAFEQTPQAQQLRTELQAYWAKEDAARAALNAVEETIPSSRGLDRAIEQARRAGPEGSPARAQALKDLVSRYGGDPNLIDDLLAVRGADASESAWAIKENILSHNARRAGYDGVLTVQGSMPPHEYQAALEKAVQAHPDYQAQQVAVKAADDAVNVLAKQREAIPYQYADEAARQRAYAVNDNAYDEAFYAFKSAQNKLANIHDRLLDEVHVDVPSKITELMDVREGANPTPGTPHPAEQARAQYEALQQQAFDAQRRLGYNDPETQRLWGETEKAYAEYERLGGPAQASYPSGPPGYTLRSDIRRRGGETTVPATMGISPAVSGLGTRLAADIGSSAGSGVMGAAVGAGAPAETDEERRRNALIGAGLGMVAGPVASRLMRRSEGGALATLGPTPGGNVQRASESANPNIRNVARMMQGDYKPTGMERPLGERIVAALTDRYAIHANVASEARSRIAAAGTQQPLERLAERVRENANSIAAQRSREEIGPALRSVGTDDDWLAQYLVHRHNIDIAVQKGQDAYDAAIQAGKSPARAQMIQQRVQQNRAFSGGMTLPDAVQAVNDIRTEVGPSRFQKIEDAAQAYWDAGQRNLDRKVQAGILDPQMAADLKAKYPHYVRTDIADYFDKGPANPAPGGKALGISTTGIKPISVEGTTKDRVNPLLSTIDSIYSTENAITRNRAAGDLVAVRDADQTTAQLFKEVAPDVRTWRANQQTMVPPDYTLRNGEQKLTQWANGDARQFVIPSEYAQLLTPAPGALLGDTAAPVRTFFGVLKALITTHNPAFQYLVSPIRDAGDAAVAMQVAAGRAVRRPGASGLENAAREFGASAAALPEVAYRYAQALPQVFQGALSNTYGPRAAELLRAGAGFESRPSGERGLREAMRELQRTGGVEIKSPGDALRVLRSFATLGAERFGSRMEMLPRVAAANMEQARGGDLLAQSTAYKDATIDFLRGGWLTRQMSVPVMFLNPTVQSVAQTQRLARKSPAAYTAALITTVGIPALLAEAWNRSDPARAQSYADRPDYLKNTGIVIEAPGIPAGTGRTGEALPNYVYLPLGNHAYAARLAREALGLADNATGLISPPDRPADDRTSPGYWARLGADILNMFSPLKGGDATAVAAGLVPPGLRDVIEQGINKNLYTGGTIATDRTDENASTLSQAVAGGLNQTLGTEVRPSQVEHEITGPLGYGGRLAAAASDMLVGRQRPEQHPIQDIPVVGGLARSFVRDTGGQQLQNARDDMLAPEIVAALHDAGLRSDQVQAVPSTLQNVPLTRDEQTEWQRRTNDYLDQEISRAAASPRYNAPGGDKAKVIQDAISRAKERAGAEVLRTIPPAERRQRTRDAEERKAS